MSILSQAIRKISAPVATVASFVPTPLGQGLAVGAGIIAQDTAKREFKNHKNKKGLNLWNLWEAQDQHLEIHMQVNYS